MAARISVSASEKVGTNNYGSIGAQCSIEIELDSRLADDPAALHEQITRYQEAATVAMRSHLGRMTANPTTGKANGTTAQSLQPPASSTGNGQPATGNGTAKPTSAAPAAAAAPTNPPRTNGPRTAAPAKAQAAPTAAPAPAKTPMQPPDARIALDQELGRQFAPRDPEPDDIDPLCEEDDEPVDDTPRSGIELLGWARHRPGDAKQELAQIGAKRGFPRLIKDWSPTMVSQALQIYFRTSAT
jgi:hypothetical protein